MRSAIVPYIRSSLSHDAHTILLPNPTSRIPAATLRSSQDPRLRRCREDYARSGPQREEREMLADHSKRLSASWRRKCGLNFRRRLRKSPAMERGSQCAPWRRLAAFGCACAARHRQRCTHHTRRGDAAAPLRKPPQRSIDTRDRAQGISSRISDRNLSTRADRALD
jgi:hypothetical protein